ncbi:MAG: rod shape-determining protein MreD [Pseudomonadota bacterium]
MALLGVLITGLIAIFATIAPVGIGPSAWYGPHLLLCALGFWAARRPEGAPALIIFPLGLANDLLRDGPVGAETFALLVVIEILKLISDRSPARGFWIEWLRFAVLAVVFEGILQLLFALTLTPAPDWTVIAERAGATALLYAPIALVLQKTTRVTRRAPSIY